MIIYILIKKGRQNLICLPYLSRAHYNPGGGGGGTGGFGGKLPVSPPVSVLLALKVICTFVQLP